MAHSVSDHLHVMIADYDRFIRTVIPHYETMRAVQLELLARCLPPDGHVIDLGGGTGAFAIELVRAFAQLQVTIWELPGAVPIARSFIEAEHLSERITVESRNILESDVEGRFDCALLSAVIQVLDAERASIKKTGEETCILFRGAGESGDSSFKVSALPQNDTFAMPTFRVCLILIDRPLIGLQCEVRLLILLELVAARRPV